MVVGLSCRPETVGEPTGRRLPSSDGVVLFFTGSELGALKPCGCSGGQLGGLEKRAAVFRTVPRANRLVVDTGALVRGADRQDLIKFGILFQAFGLLGYDLVCLTPQDARIADSLNLLGDTDRRFDVIGANGQGVDTSYTFTRQFRVGGRAVTVTIVAFDPGQVPIAQAAQLFPDAEGAQTVNILILTGDAADATQEAASVVPANIDCVIGLSDMDEPQVLGDPSSGPLIFTVGRFGRHICRIDLTAGPEEVKLRFQEIPVEEGLPDDKALVELYGYYQQLVKESGLLENYPRIPLPGDLSFIGSQRCKGCHEYEYDKWSTRAHANAFATLREVGSDYDPECVICHVVGMEYTGGFVTQDKTPELKDVGCENCHGPGSAHAETFGQAGTAPPQMACSSCHTPEHSAGYAGHEEEFMEKIVHWREP